MLPELYFNTCCLHEVVLWCCMDLTHHVLAQIEDEIRFQDRFFGWSTNWKKNYISYEAFDVHHFLLNACVKDRNVHCYPMLWNYHWRPNGKLHPQVVNFVHFIPSRKGQFVETEVLSYAIVGNRNLFLFFENYFFYQCAW